MGGSDLNEKVGQFYLTINNYRFCSVFIFAYFYIVKYELIHVI